jgi:hypothetical protein
MTDVLSYKILIKDYSFAEDIRLTDFQCRVLGCFHEESDDFGNFSINQGVMASRLKKTRRAVNIAVQKICELGYIEKGFSKNEYTNIYVIISDTGIIKVGISDNPEMRRKTLQDGSPFILSVAYQVQISSVLARKIEARAHAILAGENIRREWFNGSVRVAVAAVDQAISDYGQEERLAS